MARDSKEAKDPTAKNSGKVVPGMNEMIVGLMGVRLHGKQLTHAKVVELVKVEFPEGVDKSTVSRLWSKENARLKAEEEARLKAEEKARLEAEEKARLEPEEEDGSDWYRARQKDRSIELIEGIRNCLDNPHQELEEYLGPRRPLVLKGLCFALYAGLWARKVAPNLGDWNLWGPGYPEFKHRLPDWLVWTLLQEFFVEADSVDKDVLAGARTLSEEDPENEEDKQLKEKLVIFLNNKGWEIEDSRVPAYPEPAWSAAYLPDHEAGFAEKVIKALSKKLMPDIYSRLRQLDNMLQQLNDEFEPYTYLKVLDQSANSEPSSVNQVRSPD